MGEKITPPLRYGRSELSADLVIVGGGLGGCAAALAALRRGLHVVMTEETRWIGGQLTQQAFPPDENAWIESIGGTRSYLALRQAIREHYRQHTPLTPRARANPRLNPRNGWVSRLCCESRVALAVLEAQLALYVASDALQLLLRHRAAAADVTGDRVRAIAMRHVDTGDQRILHAPYFADATELGTLLPLTGTEYHVGAESQAMTT